jgi:hypothetical protein
MLLMLLVLASGVAPTPHPVVPNAPPASAARDVATSATPVAFDQQALGFGEAWQFGSVQAAYTLRNQGTTPARVVGIVPAQPGAQVEFEPGLALPPGGQVVVRIRQALGTRLGRVAFRYSVSIEPGAVLRKLTLAGFVQSAYDPERAVLDFGTVDRALGGTRLLGLATREAARLGVLAIEGAPEWLRVEAQPDASDSARAAVQLRARVGAGAPLGLQAGVLRVRTDLERQPIYEVAWRAAIFGDAVPAQPGLDLGLLRQGAPHTATLRLQSRTRSALDVRRVEVDGTDVQASARPCEHEPGCVDLHVQAKPHQLGTLAGRLLVHLAGTDEALPIPYAGLVVRTDAQVRDLPLPESPAETAAPAPTPTTTPSPVPSAGPTSDARRVTLRWRAARETGVYGYLVYRAVQREGPYVRLAPAIVRVPEDGAVEHAYEYVDADVLPGHTYFYYLDSISSTGSKQTFSGVLTRRIAPDTHTPTPVGPP